MTLLDRVLALGYHLRDCIIVNYKTVDRCFLFGAKVMSPPRSLAMSPPHEAFWAMSRWQLPVLPLLLAGVLSTLGAQAIPPPPESFDGETIRCQRAGSAATVLICRDAELTAIDGQLRQAFRRLRDDASLKQPEREALIEDQRRWVETMDQCWRAQENLRTCVKASQQQRLRQLEALAMPRRLMPGSNDGGKGCRG
ncbi:hypothetical protein KQ313_03110 [Synechococcus sp. CS-1325]|nr:hypothetical protein [Synechococcus sp. CS-1325]